MHELAFFRIDAAQSEDARNAQTTLIEDAEEDEGAELEDERESDAG
jgi:hypothetical protein